MKDAKGEVCIVILVPCVMEDSCCEFELKLAWALVRLCLNPKEKKIPLFFLTYLTLGKVLSVFNHGFCLFLESASTRGLLGVCKPLLSSELHRIHFVVYFPEESSHSFHKVRAGTYRTVRHSCVCLLICSFFPEDCAFFSHH